MGRGRIAKPDKLLEREEYILILETALADARSGSGCIALVSGEAGIGKTSLVEAFADRCRKTTPVLWGGCDPLFTPRPLGPLQDMAPGVNENLRELLRAGAPRAQIFSAVLEEAKSRPTVFIFEDVHWADEATLDLLRFLGRRIHQSSTLLVITYRDDELGPRHPLRGLLGELVSSAETYRLPLPPLSELAVRELAEDKMVDPVLLHQQTGGNPFFVTEILSHTGSELPINVREAVLARASHLSDSGYAVLEAASVIGEKVEPWLLATVSGAEASAVEESLMAGILTANGDELAFRHELARQAILETISPLKRQVLNRMVLDALKSAPSTSKDLARLVHHAEAAGDIEAILAYAPEAGKEAARQGMHRAATTLYALALRHAGDLPIEKQINLHEAHAMYAQHEPGRFGTINSYRRAAELAHEAGLPLREGQNLVRLAGTLLTIQRSDEVDELLNRALSLLEPLAPNRGLIDAYRVLAMKSLSQGEPEKAYEYAQKGHKMALAEENIQAIVGLSQIAGLCLLPLDHEAGCRQLEESLALALEHRIFFLAATVYPNLIMTYIDVFKLKRAEQMLAEAIPFTHDHDLDTAANMLQAWQAMLLMYQGHWEESQALVDSLLQQNLEPGSRSPALGVLGRLRARQGQADAQAPIKLALEQSLQGGNIQRRGIYYCALAEAAWLAGDREGALQYARSFYETAIHNRLPGYAAELAYWRWRAGDEVETYDWMVRPFVLEIHGDWQGAAGAWEELGCPYERARALAGGDTRAQIAALEIFERLGAQPEAGLLRQKLRTEGIAGIPPRPRASTRQNPFGLTNRQLEILELLIEDKSNAEIAARLHISPKTVDHHVSAILARMEVSSREEAAAAALANPDYTKNREASVKR